MMDRERIWKRVDVMKEVKQQLRLAGPLFVVGLLQYSLQVISVMFVGHLGVLPLSGAAIATSFASVTGFNVLMGLASALDTLCGQSFGAEQHHMVGIHTQRAMLVVSVVSVFLAAIWANTKSVLLLAHQDAAISEEAGHYACFMIPSLFAFGFGSKGAALANSISYWINLILLALYVRYSSSCTKSWTGFSKEAIRNIFSFLKTSIPSALMLCLKVWSFELMVLLSGLLPNPKLETSVLSISLNTLGMVWMIPFGLSAAASTRVSNELGARQPQVAKLAANIVLVIAIAECVVVGIIMVLLRNVWGHVYSNEKEVVKYIAEMMPILAASSFLDGIQTVLSGIARGCGWQKIGAWINLGSYYILGVPVAVTLAFVLHLKAKGLWLGIMSAFLLQVLLFLIITIRADWDKQANKVAVRVNASETTAANEP
ncbi:hypothetical protein REPUB_Repub07fG0100300 [Reevesia pubescens]